MNRVFKVPDFDKYAKKALSKSNLDELNNFIEQLKQNSAIGKPLSYEFLREKKNKRQKNLFFSL